MLLPSSVHPSQTWGHARRERGRGEGEEDKGQSGTDRRAKSPVPDAQSMPIMDGLRKIILLKQVLKSHWVIQGSVKG